MTGDVFLNICVYEAQLRHVERDRCVPYRPVKLTFTRENGSFRPKKDIGATQKTTKRYSTARIDRFKLGNM